MRRKDRERSEAFALEVLRDCEYATLATINTDKTPYCIPISPVLIEDTLYFHCAHEGQKISNINENNSVCVSCVSYTKLIPEEFTTEYESAVVKGKCKIVSDEDEKNMVLKRLCEKYAKSNMEQSADYIAKSINKTSVYKIKITKITGKANSQRDCCKKH